MSVLGTPAGEDGDGDADGSDAGEDGSDADADDEDSGVTALLTGGPRAV